MISLGGAFRKTQMPPIYHQSQVQKHKSLFPQTTPTQLSQILLNDSIQQSLYSLIACVFGSYESYLKLSKQLESVPRSVCLWEIYPENQTYYCKDCVVEEDNDAPTICAKCFKSSFLSGKHQEHRYGIDQNQMGLHPTCDCGSIPDCNPSGYCSDHNGKSDYGEQLDQGLVVRLKQGIKMLLELLLFTIESMMEHINLKRVERMENVSQTLLARVQKLVNVLCAFISEFCYNKFSLQHEVSKIMIEPLRSKRNHNCSETDPPTFWTSQQEHICERSAIDLLFKYNLFFGTQTTQSLSTMMVSLLPHEPFRAKFFTVYNQNFPFFCVLLKQNPTNRLFLSPTWLSQLYLHLYGQSVKDIVPNSEFLLTIEEIYNKFLHEMNFKYFQPFYLMVPFTLNGYFRQLKLMIRTMTKIQPECQNFDLESIPMMLRMARKSNFNYGYSYEHHQNKIIVVSWMLAVVYDFMQESKPLKESRVEVMSKLIKDYLGQDREEPSKEELTDQTIVLEWAPVDDLMVGTMLIKLYTQLGAEELAKIIQPQEKEVRQFILRIMKALVNAHKISKSKEVGFPNELPPNLLYRLHYLSPMMNIFDTSISVLQLMALVVPEWFSSQLLEFQFQQTLHLLSNILLEESCFINTCKKMKIENVLVQNALQLQFINILNLKKNSALPVLQQTFLNQMFLIPLNEALQKVSVYNQQSQTFSVKVEYQNMTESILVKRATTFFGNFFDQDNSIINLLKKDNLLEKQIEMDKPTLCSVVTVELLKSEGFLDWVQKLSDYLWQCTFQSQNFELIKLMYGICIRSQGDLNIESILHKIIEKKPTTKSQKITHKLLSRLTLQELKLSFSISASYKETKKDRSKLMFQRLKQQQEEFTKNNQTLIEETKPNPTDNRQDEQVCLICLEPATPQKPMASIMLVHQRKTDTFIALTSYFTCGHSFHEECVGQLLDNPVCPACSMFFGIIFTHPALHEITFLDPLVSNTVAVNSQTPFKFLNTPVHPSRLLQMFLFKINHSILYSYNSFKRESTVLKTIFSHMIVAQEKSNIIYQLLPNILYTFISPKNRSETYKSLLQMIYKATLIKDSVKTKEILEGVISDFYTRYLACNFLCFADGTLTQENYENEFKMNEDILKHQMGEYVKGVIILYCVMFEDKRNSFFQSDVNEETAVDLIVNLYPEFFKINKKIFDLMVRNGLQNPEFKGITLSSLLPTPPTIKLPETFLEFHHQYNDLRCHECKDFPEIHKSRYFICLQCGYKCCTGVNPKHLDLEPFQLLYNHISEHRRQCIVLDLHTLQICLFFDNQYFVCGYLYKDIYGQTDRKEIKDWNNIRLDHLNWNTILENFRKQRLYSFCIQKKLEFHDTLE